MMRTAKGKVVEIQHNVMTPQPYNRLYQLTGTKGFANKYPIEGLAIGGGQLRDHGYTPTTENLTAHEFMPSEEMQSVREHYRHPIIKKYGELAYKVGGHGGMDFFMDARLIYCLQNGLPLDMDVYDLAEWCSLGELGALSMDHNSAAVAFPDFTRGHWNEVKGFRHAFASEEDERNAEVIADGFTAAQKEVVKDFDLWNLYDKMKAAEGRDKGKAEKAYRKALSKAKAKLYGIK